MDDKEKLFKDTAYDIKDAMKKADTRARLEELHDIWKGYHLAADTLCGDFNIFDVSIEVTAAYLEKDAQMRKEED